ncbi:lipid-A-disaccharide synthase [Leptolyngbya sp. 7M]|uniref:lipid-A-disaccharide synthase n=1 Tax=Leptolyngbya sp. 7M TaxID=2812896 RepID=UPI001B8BFAC5|nr:hypothetical protein [Leptolyngbya sp. 7M]QYO63530.1 hypothetical protein JVX88_27120 [Leptolyngbya sp. 7M]
MTCFLICLQTVIPKLAPLERLTAQKVKQHGVDLFMPVFLRVMADFFKLRQFCLGHNFAKGRYVDLLISILPFEKDWYASRGISHVEYVGSPLAREVHVSLEKSEFCSNYFLDPSRPIVALLPGSRTKEVTKIFPTMLKAAAKMHSRDTKLQFAVALADERFRPLAADAVESITDAPQEFRDSISLISGATYDLLNAADTAAVASGTATLETGIIGTPMVIVYKTTALNYKLLRPLIDVEHFGLINLIAGERIAKELIQDEFTPEALGEELFRLLDPVNNGLVREKLRSATDKLGHGGASKRAAEAIARLLEY